MITHDDIISVGKFLKTHGLKGELNFLSEGYQIDLFEQGYPLIVETDGIFVPYYLESVRPKSTFGMLFKLDDIDSAEDAPRFVNSEVYMMRSDVAHWLDVPVEELETEENYIGFTAIRSKDGLPMGEIVGVVWMPEYDLYEVRRPDGSTFHFPMVDDFIDHICESNHTIVLSLPEGMEDLI